MKRRSGAAVVLLVVLAALFALALGGGCWAKSGYDNAVGLDENVDRSWAQVENILQSRYDLIPNLVETVKGYAKHETELFEKIAEARTKYFQAARSGNRSEKVAAAGGFESVLSRLLVLREAYPELKAQEGFLRLQDSLEGTERRLAVERKRFNDAVGGLNTFQRSMFGRMFCGWAGVGPAEYFEAPEEAQEVPKVDFGSGE